MNGGGSATLAHATGGYKGASSEAILKMKDNKDCRPTLACKNQSLTLG